MPYRLGTALILYTLETELPELKLLAKTLHYLKIIYAIHISNSFVIINPVSNHAILTCFIRE